MAYAELSMRFAASADKVWNALTGAALIPVLLATYAANIEIDGGAPGAGAILVTTLSKGGTVREKIESIDNDERCMKYRVLDAGPLATGRWMGLQNAVGNVAGMSAPVVTGYLVQQTGHYTSALIVAGVVALCGLVAWLLIVPEVRPIDWATEQRIDATNH